MASSAKKSRLDCESGTVDRISNLPRDLLELIVDRMTLHEAARTAILSKTWRNIWGTHPHLVFDDAFVFQLVSNAEDRNLLSLISTTITNILLVHSGPVLKFHLCIPKYLPFHRSLATDCWIKNIANKGVRILEIFNHTVRAYKMPYYFFSCLELTHLSLSNCVLNAPLNFGGFPNLIIVELLDVKMTADMTFGSQLKKLDLKQCTGIQHLGCQFNYNNNLDILKIVKCSTEEINWRWFECTKKLQKLCLVLRRSENPGNNFINLDKLLCNMHSIQHIFVNSSFLKFLEPAGAAILKRLMTTVVVNLKTLYFVSLEFYDLVQIQYVLCLIRSSPNLQNLYVSLENNVNPRVGAAKSLAASKVEQLLQLPNLFDIILDQLETVTICRIVGSNADLLFIKFLLASSPSLKWMKLSIHTTINDLTEELRILQQLPRASPTAEIIICINY